MGSYTDLIVNGRVIYTTKSYPSEIINWVFTQDDILIYDEIDQISTENGQTTSKHLREVHLLLTTATNMLDRLNILGYNESSIKKEFESFLFQKNEEINDAGHLNIYGSEIVEKEKEFWRNANFEKWKKAVSEIFQDSFKFITVKDYDTSLYNIESHICFQGTELITSMPFTTFLGALTFILISVPSDSEIIQDYSEIYNGGWVDDETIIDTSVREKTIILTEGLSDISILKPCLKLLYPHLYDFYSFFDFEGYNNQGGAGNLVNLIKSFAGAGIRNKLIAIFDNDSAAKDAQLSLTNLNLPNHFKIINYPNLDLANNYPTIGPTGIHNTNINGLACSIEMYLGEDVLINEKEEYVPIQWKGFIPKVNAYQGELLDKSTIQKKFLQKLKLAQSDDGANISNQDWTGLTSIFKAIFNCFN